MQIIENAVVFKNSGILGWHVFCDILSNNNNNNINNVACKLR